MGQAGSAMDEDPQTQSDPIHHRSISSSSRLERRRASDPTSSKKADARQRTERKLEGRMPKVVVEASLDGMDQQSGLGIGMSTSNKRLARTKKSSAEVAGPTLVPDSHGSADSVHERFKKSAVPVQREQSFAVKRIPAPRPTSTLLDFPTHRSTSTRREKSTTHLPVPRAADSDLSSHWSPSTAGEPSPVPGSSHSFRNSIMSTLSSSTNHRHSRASSSRYSGIFAGSSSPNSNRSSPKFNLSLSHKKKSASIRKRGPIVIVSAQRVASGRYSMIKDAGNSAAATRKAERPRQDSVTGLSDAAMFALAERRRSSGASVSTARRVSVADAISHAKRVRSKSVDIARATNDEWVDEAPPPPPPKSHKHASSTSAIENFIAASPNLAFPAPTASLPERVGAAFASHPANHHARFKAKGRKNSVTALEPAPRRASRSAAPPSSIEEVVPTTGVAGGRRPSVNRIEHKRKLSNYRISIAQSASDSWTTTVFSERGESMIDPLPIFPSALRKPTGNATRHQSFPRSVSFASDYTNESRSVSKVGSVSSISSDSELPAPLEQALSKPATVKDDPTSTWKHYTMSPPRMSSASVPSISSLGSENLKAFPTPPPATKATDPRARQSIPVALNLDGATYAAFAASGSGSSSGTSPLSFPSPSSPSSPESISSFSTLDSVDDILIKRPLDDLDELPDIETIEAQFESLVPTLLKRGSMKTDEDHDDEPDFAVLTPKIRRPLSPVVHTIELHRMEEAAPVDTKEVVTNFVPEKRLSASSLDGVTPIVKPHSLAARHQLRLNLSDFKLRPSFGGALQLPGGGASSTNLISPMSQPHMTSYFNPDLPPASASRESFHSGSEVCHWDFGPTVVVTPPVDEKRCFLDFGGPLIVTPPVSFERRESYGMLVPSLVVTPPVEEVERSSFFEPKVASPAASVVVATTKMPRRPSALNEVTSMIQAFDFTLPESPDLPINLSPATTIAPDSRKASIVSAMSDDGFARAAQLQQGKSTTPPSSEAGQSQRAFGQWTGEALFQPPPSPSGGSQFTFTTSIPASGRRETAPCTGGVGGGLPFDMPRLRQTRAATYDANAHKEALRRGSRVGPDVCMNGGGAKGGKRGFNKVEIRSWLLEQRKDSVAVGPGGEPLL